MRPQFAHAALLLTIALLAAFFFPAAGFGQMCPNANPATAPQAMPDKENTTAVGASVTVRVLSNDVVDLQGALNITSVSQGANGTVVRNADNTITYTPTALAEDTVTYTITDVSQPGSSSQSIVRLIPPQPVLIIGVGNGLHFDFEARPPITQGITSYSWTFGDGASIIGTQAAISHDYQSPGTFQVTVTVGYQSGSPASGSYTAVAEVAPQLNWTVTPDGLSGMVNVAWSSLHNFPGGPHQTRVDVTWSDDPSDCINAVCGVMIWCDTFHQYCHTTGQLYHHGGTYTVRATVTDSSNGGVYHYAKSVTVVDQQPFPDFTFVRDVPTARRYTFDPTGSTDELMDIAGYSPTPFEWDFGDGTSESTANATPVSHTYTQTGSYTVTLRLTDFAEQVGLTSYVVQVNNTPPVPKIAVNCSLLDCTFRGDGSLDDGGIQNWEWSFGDGTTGTGMQATKHYNTPGCYTVSLKTTDAEGLFATATLKIVVGPRHATPAGGVVVDAHVQSYQANQQWETTNGNLNGIIEPGETVVLEPNWNAAATTSPVFVNAFGLTSTDWAYARPELRDYAGKYDLSTGTADCWAAGRCYALQLASSGRDLSRVHNDVTFSETYLSTGQPTPGSPVTVHVGASFNDVPPAHWAYPYIESALHAGIAGAVSGLNFAPHTALTRGDIARWLVLAKYGPSFNPPECVTPPFNDVPCSHPHAKWIAQIKADGITVGVGGGNYAPEANLTRAAMSVFVLRTKEGGSYTPPACQWDFGDAPCPQYGLASWISEVKRRNISLGCAANEFCPEATVDRAQAAAFLVRTFGWNLAVDACAGPTFDTVQGHVPRPPIASLAFVPSPVLMGTTSTGTLTLGLATQHGVTVPLSIDNPSAITIPASVFIPPGVFSATFEARAANVVDVRTPTNISATYLGQTFTTQLDVCTPPPAISVQPASQTIYRGQQATLSVTASGGGPLTYQWYQNGAPIPVGGNNPTLPVWPAVTTTYHVVVSNACGSTTSATATVTVCEYPVITGPPLNDWVVIGSTATLRVTASGSGPITYQWYEGATPIPDATGPAYTTPALTTPHAYWVRVTSTCNGVANVDSPPATVTPVTQITRRQIAANTVNSQLSITTNWSRPTQLGSLLIAVVTSSSAAVGVGAFTPPAGWQQAVVYEFNNIKTAIYYYPNNPGSRTAETFAMAGYRESVLQLFEYVGGTAEPFDRSAFDGDHLPRNGEVSTGLTPPTSQPKELAISALSMLGETTFTNPGDGFVKIDERSSLYDVTAAVHERILTTTGSYSHSASTQGNQQWVGMIATFKSIDGCTVAPAITAHPVSTTIDAGTPAALSVTATGDGLAYQWFEGVPPATAWIPGANSSTFNPTPSVTTTYWVRVSNACGTVNSNTATVNVCAPLAIATHPLSQTVTSGYPATLSVTLSGSGPFSYQWYEGASGVTTTPIPGATNPTFTTPPLTANKSYWVRVTSTCLGTDSVNSSAAVLTVSSANQIARRQFAANTANSQTSITTNWTQPTQAGSLLVAILSAQHVAAVGNFTPPAGWQLATSYEWTNIKSAIYYYPNHPGGRTSETFGVANFRELVLQLIEYTGATAAPLDKVASNGSDAVLGAEVSTGTTPTTSQPKEVVVTALTIMAPGSFTNATNGFVKLDERSVFNMITSAVHERFVSAANQYGHEANVDANAQWVGLVATFKSLDLCGAAPSITTHPASQSINSGQTATLSVTASTSGGTLGYQWYEGPSATTTTPVGTNSPTFTTPALTTTKSYWVRVSNECGNIASNTATITVAACGTPGIATQPASQTINAGATATLTVTPSGTGPFTYQWYEGTSGTTTTPAGTDAVWIEDSLPAGAIPYGSSESWSWVSVNPPPFGGSLSHQSATVSGMHQHHFDGATATLSVGTGERLFSHIYLDPSNPPTQVMLQWSDGTWEHRAYWGANLIPWGADGTSSRRYMGALPAAGQWVRLEVPASLVGLEGRTLQGMAFTLYNGRATWDRAGKVTPSGLASSFTTPLLATTQSYWVRVTSTCNGSSVNSNTATITVCRPAGIATHPASQTINSGGTATLTVTPGGSGPFTYQWYEGPSGTTTTPVGTNSASFTTPALTATKSYWVRVTSTCNGTASVNSNAATITVNAAVIARRQLAGNTAQSQLGITTNWTQPTQAGTLLVAIVSAQRGFYPIANWTAPAGWQLAKEFEWTNIKTSIYYYPNNPGGRASETFNTGGYYDNLILQLAEYTGIVTTSPLDKTAFNAGDTNDGYVETGYAPLTSQAKELVITALTVNAKTEFSNPSPGHYIEIDDRSDGDALTTAVHELTVNGVGYFGHNAQVFEPSPWVGLVVTFKGQ